MTALFAATSTQSSGGSALIWFIPIVLFAVLFLFSRRRQQQMRRAQHEVQVGDEVTTTSGLYGRIVELDDQVATIEAAPGVQLRYNRRAVLPANYAPGSAPGQPAGAGSHEPTEARPATDIDIDKKA